VSEIEPVSASHPHPAWRRSWGNLLIASIAINVLLAGWIVFGTEESTPSPVGGASAPAGTPAKTASVAIPEIVGEGAAEKLKDRIGTLRGRVEGDEALLAVVATEVRENLDRAGTGEYWTPRPMREGRARVARDELRAAYRSVLVETFGEAIASNPLMSEVFAPNATRWAYLPAEKRARLESEISRDLRARFAGGSAGAVNAGTDADRQQRIRAVLGDEQYFEYSLRESALADQLLAIDFSFTESEFRAVYSIWDKALGPNKSELRGILRTGERPDDPVMAKIGSALGAERFALYRRAQDPVYRLVRSTVRLANVDAAKAEAAYAILEQTKQKAAGLMGEGGPVIGTDTRKKLEQLKLDRSKKLVALLGAPATEVLERSMGPFDAMDLSVGMFPVVAR
jgi:hypothetical protein